MKKSTWIFLLLMIFCLSSGCGSMQSTEQNGSIGAVAGSLAGQQATPKKGPGSLGSFLYLQNRKTSAKTN